MSFSHIALTVSDLPSAASFYAAALQPLGYRYIGKEGNSLGFGVDSANFFITPGPKGVRVTPSHVAFHADSRDVVRQCYAAAVRAQGLTTGAPSCRNDDCDCFNAAVEDLDGHMIEFIYRQPHGGDRDAHRSPNFKHTCSKKTTSEDDKSQAHDQDGSNPPRPGLARSKTDSLLTGRGLLGMGVAAAAGAALMYSLVNTEKKNTQEEMAFAASAAAAAPAPAPASAPPRSTLSARRAPTVAIEATPPTPPSVAQSQAKSRHRNFSATESHVSARRTRMLALEDEENDGDDDDFQESRAMNVYEARRIVPRSANDQFIYIPASVDGGSDHYTIRRAATMPLEAVPVAASAPAASHQYLLGPPPRSSASRRSSHHGTRSHAVSSHSSRHSSRHHHSSSGRSHHGSEHSRHSHRSSKSSRHHEGEESSSRREEKSSRHDSAVSVARDGSGRSSTSASSSTIKPATRRDSVLQQSPGSKAGSKASSKAGSKASSHIDTHSYWPAGVALPPSVSGYTLTSSSHSSGRLRPSSHYATAIEEVVVTHGASSNSGRSHNSAARIPLPLSVAGTAAEAWEEEDDDYNPRRSGDDDNNVTDSELNPNDSISCVGIPRPPRRRVHRSKHHRIREESGSEKEDEKAEETPSAAGRRRGNARREEIEHGVRELPPGGASRGNGSGSAPGGSRFSAVTLPFRFRGPASARRSVHSYA